MRIEQLEYFVTTADYHYMQKTADFLYSSIQNVSKSIKLLEHELNTPLFTRTKHGVFLTADGEYVYQEAKEALMHINNILQKYLIVNKQTNRDLKGELKILTCMAFKRTVGNILSQLHKSYPMLTLVNNIEETLNINKMIFYNSDIFNAYQAIITGVGQNELKTIKQLSTCCSAYFLSKYYIGVHVAPNHPLTQFSEVPLKALLSFPLVTVHSSSGSQLSKIIQEEGISLKPSLYTNSSEQCTEFIADGMGYGLYAMSERSIFKPLEKFDTIVIPLREKIFITYLLILPPDDLITPQIISFKKEIFKTSSDNCYRII